jgi:hypothetical protein
MKVLTPKDDLNNINNLSGEEFSVFLAGGMGSPWRAELIGKLDDLPNLVIIDPSVDDWEKDVGEESADNPKFVKQTDWEHQGLEASDVQVFHFDASSEAPISLLELGLFKTNNTIFCVREGYKHKAHIDLIARRNGLSIELSTTALAALITLKYHTLPKRI